MKVEARSSEDGMVTKFEAKRLAESQGISRAHHGGPSRSMSSTAVKFTTPLKKAKWRTVGNFPHRSTIVGLDAENCEMESVGGFRQQAEKREMESVGEIHQSSTIVGIDGANKQSAR
jgi:hypothetical protein